MSLGGFNCPFCRYYNARDAKRCGRCGKVLPPAALAPIVAKLRMQELWATKILCGICVVVFALEMADSAGQFGAFTMRASTLVRFGALTGNLVSSEPWRLLSACFVHIGLLHVGMNVLALADLGRLCEPMVGAARFVIAFVITGILGFLVSTWWYGPSSPITAGASGAIFGIIGVILGDMVVRRDPRWRDFLVRTLLYSFIFFFALRTNQAAHLGGLAVGTILGALFRLESRPWKVAWLTTTLTVLSFVAIGASLVLPQFSPRWHQWRAVEMAMDGR